MGVFKRLILLIEGTEDESDLDINWSTAYMGAFKRLIIWIESTEDENDLDINWSTAYVGDLNDLYYGLKVLRMKMTHIEIDQLLIWELLKDLYYGLKALRMKMTLI